MSKLVDAKIINNELGTYNEILTFEEKHLNDNVIVYEDVETGEYYYPDDLEIINN